MAQHMAQQNAEGSRDLSTLVDASAELQHLVQTIWRLRQPDGCPWDRVQTRESITPNLLEECYELYDALKSDDTENIVEESGDVLLQLAFHATFGEENHEFDRGDVVSGICRKLIDRHTRVFGGDSAADGASALAVWEQNKKKEKKVLKPIC